MPKECVLSELIRALLCMSFLVPAVGSGWGLSREHGVRLKSVLQHRIAKFAHPSITRHSNINPLKIFHSNTSGKVINCRQCKDSWLWKPINHLASLTTNTEGDRQPVIKASLFIEHISTLLSAHIRGFPLQPPTCIQTGQSYLLAYNVIHISYI